MSTLIDQNQQVRSDFRLFAGRANPALAKEIAGILGVEMGKITIGPFPNSETRVQIEESIRGTDIYIVQPTSEPANENLMELVIIVDALRRSSAHRITAVVSYFGYSRQDRRARSGRVPISAKLAANIIAAAGVDRVLTIDLHADQEQGFFDIPVDNIYASPILIKDIWHQDGGGGLVTVSPDIGGVVRARAFAKQLDSELAIIDKRRPNPNESEVMNIIGEVEGMCCVMVDDMVDTAGTLCHAAAALKERGATRVVAYVTHPVLSGQAIENLANSTLDELVVTDTIPLSEEAGNCDRIRVLSVSELLAESISRIHRNESISTLFIE